MGRASGWLFVAMLGAVLLTSAIAFPRLQQEVADRIQRTQSLVNDKPRRFVGYHLARRPETSLEDLASPRGPFTRIDALAYAHRRGYYQIQRWLIGHEARGPEGGDLFPRLWSEMALVPFEVDPALPRLRHMASYHLSPMVVREVNAATVVYAFLFDPDSTMALAEDEGVVLLRDPDRARRIFVTSTRRLPEIEGVLR
jgi:hypothetical protein